MRFFNACGGAAVALVTRRAAELLWIMNFQEVGARMAGEGLRVLVRFFAGQRHGGRGDVDRLAYAQVAGLAAVDILGAVFVLEIGGVLVLVDLAYAGGLVLHAGVVV